MIVACFDFSDGWTFSGEPSSAFAVCFADGDADRLYPDRLGFGWTLTVNGEETAQHEWPAANAVVREITRQRTFEFRIGAKADDEIVLALWASESGQRVEDETTFVVPRPAQPFPSWTWVDGSWTAPVAYPDGEGWYSWDEDAQAWVEQDVIDGG